MAIKVNGTTVINDSRALSNIASVDATTVAALGAAGVGGANINSFTVLNSSVNTYDGRSVPEEQFNFGYTLSGLPPSYITLRSFTSTKLVSLAAELNTTSTADSTFISNFSTSPGADAYAGYQLTVYYYTSSTNTSKQVLNGTSTNGRAQAFFPKDATYKTVAIRDNIPQLNMSLRPTANGDKILFAIGSANYWGGSFTLNANVIKFNFLEVS